MSRLAAERAHDLYRARRVEIERRLVALHRLLNAHAKAEARDPLNWGYAGDLGGILDALKTLPTLEEE